MITFYFKDIWKRQFFSRPIKTIRKFMTSESIYRGECYETCFLILGLGPLRLKSNLKHCSNGA